MQKENKPPYGKISILQRKRSDDHNKENRDNNDSGSQAERPAENSGNSNPNPIPIPRRKMLPPRQLGDFIDKAKIAAAVQKKYPKNNNPPPPAPRPSFPKKFHRDPNQRPRLYNPYDEGNTLFNSQKPTYRKPYNSQTNYNGYNNVNNCNGYNNYRFQRPAATAVVPVRYPSPAVLNNAPSNDIEKTKISGPLRTIGLDTNPKYMTVVENMRFILYKNSLIRAYIAITTTNMCNYNGPIFNAVVVNAATSPEVILTHPCDTEEAYPVTFLLGTGYNKEKGDTYNFLTYIEDNSEKHDVSKYLVDLVMRGIADGNGDVTVKGYPPSPFAPVPYVEEIELATVPYEENIFGDCTISDNYTQTENYVNANIAYMLYTITPFTRIPYVNFIRQRLCKYMSWPKAGISPNHYSRLTASGRKPHTVSEKKKEMEALVKRSYKKLLDFQQQLSVDLIDISWDRSDIKKINDEMEYDDSLMRYKFKMTEEWINSIFQPSDTDEENTINVIDQKDAVKIENDNHDDEENEDNWEREGDEENMDNKANEENKELKVYEETENQFVNEYLDEADILFIEKFDKASDVESEEPESYEYDIPLINFKYPIINCPQCYQLLDPTEVHDKPGPVTKKEERTRGVYEFRKELVNLKEKSTGKIYNNVFSAHEKYMKYRMFLTLLRRGNMFQSVSEYLLEYSTYSIHWSKWKYFLQSYIYDYNCICIHRSSQRKKTRMSLTKKIVKLERFHVNKRRKFINDDNTHLFYKKRVCEIHDVLCEPGTKTEEYPKDELDLLAIRNNLRQYAIPKYLALEPFHPVHKNCQPYRCHCFPFYPRKREATNFIVPPRGPLKFVVKPPIKRLKLPNLELERLIVRLRADGKCLYNGHRIF